MLAITTSETTLFQKFLTLFYPLRVLQIHFLYVGNLDLCISSIHTFLLLLSEEGQEINTCFNYTVLNLSFLKPIFHLITQWYVQITTKKNYLELCGLGTLGVYKLMEKEYISQK